MGIDRRIPSSMRLGYKAASSNRVRLTLASSALSSAGSFLLTIGFARNLSIAEFGQYATSMAVVLMGIGLQHASVAEPVIALSDWSEEHHGAAKRAALVGLITALAMVTIGLITSSIYFLWGSLASIGLVIYDYHKTINCAVDQPQIAFRFETASFLYTSAIALTVFTHTLTVHQAFTAWCIGAAIVGFASARANRCSVLPSWPAGKISSKTAAAFGIDFAVGSGMSQLLVATLALLDRTIIVGVLRAAGTLLGPVTLGISVARTLCIPLMSRYRNQKKTELETARSVTAVLMVASLPPLLFVAFLPNSIGTLLLGSNWFEINSFLPFLCLEAWLTVSALAPVAAHRAALAGKRSAVVRSALAVARFVLVIGAGVYLGATATALSLALAALLATLAWWTSFTRLPQGNNV